LKKCIDEWVTKRLHGMKGLLYMYTDRLARLGLHSLELQPLHFDLTFCCKIAFGLVNVNFWFLYTGRLQAMVKFDKIR